MLYCIQCNNVKLALLDLNLLKNTIYRLTAIKQDASKDSFLDFTVIADMCDQHNTLIYILYRKS